MKLQEVAVYREIQKNTEMAMKAMETISDKVYDDKLSLQIAKQSLKYSELHNEASRLLVEGKTEPYHGSYISDIMLKIGIRYNTFLNASTAHIAELMIRGCGMGVLEMEKILKHNPEVGETSAGLAKQFIDFEQKNIENLKDYL